MRVLSCCCCFVAVVVVPGVCGDDYLGYGLLLFLHPSRIHGLFHLFRKYWTGVDRYLICWTNRTSPLERIPLRK